MITIRVVSENGKRYIVRYDARYSQRLATYRPKPKQK